MGGTRLPLLLNEIAEQSPDVICFQEVSQLMWRDLVSTLKEFGYDGAHRSYPFGWIQAEYGVAIFWRAPWIAAAINARCIAEMPQFIDICPVEHQDQNHWAVSAALIGPDDHQVAIASVHPTWKGPEVVRIGQALATVAIARAASEQA